jgi:hypothetical protein
MDPESHMPGGAAEEVVGREHSNDLRRYKTTHLNTEESLMKTKLYLPLVVIALVCVVLWTAHAQGTRSTPGRQTWEYKSWVYILDGQNKTFYEDGKQIPSSLTPVSRAPELGAEGWELVSVTSTTIGNGSYSTYVYWFKRPR